MLRSTLGVVFVLATATSAHAQNPRLEVRYLPPEKDVAKPEQLLTGHTIYLNRCVGGCNIVPGDDDATAGDGSPEDPVISGIPNRATVLPEYDAFEPGEWEAAVQCVKEVYSPFNVTITDVRPTNGGTYQTILVGGTADQPGGVAVGAPGSGGVAFSGCAPIPKGVAYAFTDQLNIFANLIGGSRPLALCWIIAQETAHNLTLDHQFSFVSDMRSACNDPMTYESDCGGQKFFRNKFAACGVSGGIDGSPPGPRACRCAPNQNSHLTLRNLLGEGESLVPPPTVEITTPAQGSTNANTLPGQIIGSAGSKRGVERVELYLNGYKWGEVPGVAFGPQGQRNPAPYSVMVPANLPDSIYDVQLKAYDDLDLVGESEIVTVVKGPAGGCASADSCLAGQKCEAGKCFWDPPAGEIGDACEFPQFCVSGTCAQPNGGTDARVCTQGCVPQVADSCPPDTGTVCVDTGTGNGVCYFPDDGGGCCSTSDDSTPWAPFGLAGLVIGLVVFRRRK